MNDWLVSWQSHALEHQAERDAVVRVGLAHAAREGERVDLQIHSQPDVEEGQGAEGDADVAVERVAVRSGEVRVGTDLPLGDEVRPAHAEIERPAPELQQPQTQSNSWTGEARVGEGRTRISRA